MPSSSGITGCTWPAAELLARLFQREFAVADARGKALGEGRRGVLAVGGDEFGERGEQTGLRQAIAVDAVEPGFGPGFLQIAERDPLLLVVGRRIARDEWTPAGIDCHVSRPPGARRLNAVLIPERTLSCGFRRARRTLGQG